MNILEYLTEQKIERSWIEISEALGNPNPNWLHFHLKKLIYEDKVIRRQLGEYLYYSIKKEDIKT